MLLKEIGRGLVTFEKAEESWRVSRREALGKDMDWIPCMKVLAEVNLERGGMGLEWVEWDFLWDLEKVGDFADIRGKKKALDY